MPTPKNAKHLYWIAGLVILLGAAAWWYSNAHDAVPGIPDDRLRDEAAVPGSPEPDDPEACLAAGGYWDPCASACPDAGPDVACIQVCVERCEGLGEEADLRLFFNNTSFAHEDECVEVFPVERAVERHEDGWPVAAVEALLRGPADDEADEGYLTNLPDDAGLVSLTVEDGIAVAEFDEALNAVAGSCRVRAIRAQIEQTLLNFHHIDEVEISVNGETETILQP